MSLVPMDDDAITQLISLPLKFLHYYKDISQIDRIGDLVLKS